MELNSVPQRPLAQGQVLSLLDLREHIAPYLSQSDLGNMCLVSKNWHQNWNPFYWRNIVRCTPADFALHGHLVRNIDMYTSKEHVISAVRDHCPSLRRLKLTDVKLKQESFKSYILGIQPIAAVASMSLTDEGSTSSAERAIKEQPTDRVESKQFSSEPEPCFKSGYLSNTLQSIELRVPHEVCEIMLPSLIRARKAGHLQGLRAFRMHAAVITYTCIEMPPIPDVYVKLSDIYAFLDSFPELTSFSTGNMNIWDDTQQEGALGEHEQLPAAEQQKLYNRLTDLQLKARSASILEKIASRIPNVTDLSVHLAGSSNIVQINQHYPHLKSLTVDTSSHSDYGRRVDDNDLESQRRDFKYWIQLFQGLPHLESFNATYTALPLVVLESLATSCPSLKRLHLGYGCDVSIPGVKLVLRHRTGLTNLHLDCTLSPEFLANDELWRSPLETLCIKGVHITSDKDFDFFRYRMRSLPRLRSLTVMEAFRMPVRALLDPDEYNDQTTTDTNLTTVSSIQHDAGESNDHGHGGERLPATTSAPVFSSSIAYPNLEILRLEWFRDPSEEVLWNVLYQMPCLRSLQLMEKYTEVAIQQARRRFQQMMT
ncbi:hypothetical protein BGX28_005729 [Mortierella sp. GBA30]|nr:hypothetical protein BGX28_005729 [Mortierella sp. GBA30]